MTDDIQTPENAAPAAPVESAAAVEAPAEGSAAQADRAAAIIAAARKPRDAAAASAPTSAPSATPVKRGPGRPPKAPGEKRKKPSGRKPTRAELAAKVKELQAQQAAGAAPGIGGAGPAAAPAPAPSALHRPEVKARFAAGVSRGTQQLSRLIAARRGAHWTITKLEGDALGEATADALVCVEELAPSLGPYIGKAVQLAPLAIFAGVLFGIVAERVEKDADIQAGRAPRVMPPPAPESTAAGVALVKS